VFNESSSSGNPIINVVQSKRFEGVAATRELKLLLDRPVGHPVASQWKRSSKEREQ